MYKAYKIDDSYDKTAAAEYYNKLQMILGPDWLDMMDICQEESEKMQEKAQETVDFTETECNMKYPVMFACSKVYNFVVSICSVNVRFRFDWWENLKLILQHCQKTHWNKTVEACQSAKSIANDCYTDYDALMELYEKIRAPAEHKA